MPSYSLLAVPHLEKTSAVFRSELVRRAVEAGLNPNFIAAVMSFESGFNPRAVNKYSGATGLIQWMPNNFPTPNLAALSAEEQLPYAVAWFKAKNLSRLGASATPTDYYLSVFLPAFAGYAPDTILGRKGSGDLLRFANGSSTGMTLGKMYEQNPAFDAQRRGYYTVGDVGAKIENLVQGSRGRPPILVPLPVMSPPRPRTAEGVDTFSPGSPSRARRLLLSARIGSSRAVLRAATPTALPPLERGSHGPAVLVLQRLLNATMAEGEDASVDVDGEFGAQTELWVALHQVEAHLEPDGVCAELTWHSFTEDRFWGPDRIGVQVIDDPYGDGYAPTEPAPHETAAPFELRREPVTVRSPERLPKPPKTPS